MICRKKMASTGANTNRQPVARCALGNGHSRERASNDSSGATAFVHTVIHGVPRCLHWFADQPSGADGQHVGDY